MSDVKLSTLDGNNEPYAFVADMVSRTDFYAHGSAMPGRHYPGNGYRYGFNGKELDETGHYDFDARNFDARIGRFTSIDPYGSFFAAYSPYQYALNMPIILIDDGGNYPKPSAALARLGINLPALAAGMLDAFVDNLPMVGAAGFAYDLITDPVFRSQTIDALKALYEDPINTLGSIVGNAAGVIQRVLNGTASKEDMYAAGGMAVGILGVKVIKDFISDAGKIKPKADRSWKEKINGKAQSTGTEGHQVASYRIAIEMAKRPDVAAVYLDRGYNSIADLPPGSISPNRRPDVAVKYTNGKIDAFEVMSNSDDYTELVRRNQIAMKSLPSEMRGRVHKPKRPTGDRGSKSIKHKRKQGPKIIM
ncbi:MAG: hypothetical protein JNJ91_12860 [Flavobacteriales bacterium]|nr:hypothetical protein [Flavobacteriales bacterium]